MSTGTASGDQSEVDSAEIRWQQCIVTAIEYFHGHLDTQIEDHSESGDHPKRPATARDYFQSRGWGDKTISSNMLGWAPSRPNNNLVDYLRQSGYTEEEVLATGLLTEDLEPLWYGRYVFPYLNPEGSPTYAISRATGDKGGGDAGYDGHPDDFISGKYGRLAHTRSYACVSEPIFGRKSLRDGEMAIITEGIADAITIQQAGYACLSPVTTTFSRDDWTALLTLLKGYNVPRVVVIQDAERPTAGYSEDREQLKISQFSPGEKGAVDTASFLAEQGVDAYVNTPPSPGLEKVDMHDYVQEGWGGIQPLLRSAKPPQQHPAFERASETPAPTEHESPPPETNNQSGLFQLDIRDATGLSSGFRGKNPLGHTGKSENYFVIGDKKWAYDHKRNVGYNGLTYLLCEANERPIDDPNGELSDSEYFTAWRQAKKKALLTDDDPIPHNALIHIAVTHDLCDRGEIQDGWKIPPESYNSALDVVRDEYGLDPVRDEIGTQANTPAEQLTHTLVESDQNTSSPAVTLDEARERCYSSIEQALAQDTYSLLEALPAMGKSRGVIKWAAETGTPVTVLAPRRELYKQSREWCEEFGLSYHTAPSFHRDCGCATGTHGDFWQTKVHKLYNSGATPGEIHALAGKKFNQELPCEQNGDCSYLEKWDFDPDDYDVVLGYYTHAYRDDLLEGRVVAIDEAPSDAYLHEFERGPLEKAVTHYLGQKDELPFSSYTDLLEHRNNSNRRDKAVEWFEENEDELQRDGYEVIIDGTGDAHARASLLTYALLTGRNLGNGWEHARLPESGFAARNRDPNREKDEKDLTLIQPPPLESAKAVIGLDGTPWIEQWELCLGKSLTHQQVLNENERVSYLRDALNYTIYQMSGTSKPYSSGEHLTEDADATLFELIKEREHQSPDLISSNKAISAYRGQNLLESVEKYDHYGNLKGENNFKQTRLGVVSGSRHYGDTYLKKWGALADKVVERGDGDGMELDYDPFGNDGLSNMREDETLQALMRFGRDGDGATIYVNTAAIPEWVPVIRGEVREWCDGIRQVSDKICDLDEWRTGDLITENSGKAVLDTDDPDPISKRQVRRNLNTLVECGFLTNRKEGTGWLWKQSDLDQMKDDRQLLFKQ